MVAMYRPSRPPCTILAVAVHHFAGGYAPWGAVSVHFQADVRTWQSLNLQPVVRLHHPQPNKKVGILNEIPHSRFDFRSDYHCSAVPAVQAPALPAPEGQKRYVSDFWIKKSKQPQLLTSAITLCRSLSIFCIGLLFFFLFRRSVCRVGRLLLLIR